MDFYEVLDQVIDLLRRRKRASYRALAMQFNLDDASLGVLREELIAVHQLATDLDGKMLVWSGETEGASVLSSQPAPTTERPSSATDPKPPPISYTPQYLTEKILTSRGALQGERKQVTVMFAALAEAEGKA